MIKYITPNTLANTVRMGARSRRPKAVFLASDNADIDSFRLCFPRTNAGLFPRTVAKTPSERSSP